MYPVSLADALPICRGKFVFLRTDPHGVAIGSPGVVPDGGPAGPYNTVWADSGFAILYGNGWGDARMSLAYFTAVD